MPTRRSGLRSIRWRLACLLPLVAFSACTTMQTTYFRASYEELVEADDPGLVPYDGTTEFVQTEDIAAASREMHREGYFMLGYSQFVSPLYTSLAPSYATKYGRILEADKVVMANPVPGESNLHAYLVTYWARVRPEQFSFGAVLEDLPDDLLERIGTDLNVVMLPVVFPGAPAAEAGLQSDDVLIAADGVRVENTEQFVALLQERAGQEIEVSVSRMGEPLQFSVALARPEPVESKARYHEEPWRNTEPTDWSSLSQANIARMTAQIQRDMQRQQQEAYERQRQAAQQRLANWDSDGLDRMERYQSQRRGEIPRRSSSDIPRAGYIERGSQLPTRDQMRDEYGNFVEHYRKLWNSKSWQESWQRQQKLEIWFNNAPNIYGQMFTYSRPRPM